MDKIRIDRLLETYRLNNNFVEETFTWTNQFTCSFYVKVEDHGQYAVLIVDYERHFYIALPQWEIMVQTGGRLLRNE